MELTLSLLPDKFAVCRFDADSEVPVWAMKGRFFSVTRTSDELSIVCLEADIDEATQCERGWRCLKLHGPFAFNLTGVLNSITSPLARAGISIFAISTFDTDYVLVKEDSLESAMEVLRQTGHRFLTD